MILDVTSASSEIKRVVEAVYSTIVDTLVSGMGAQLYHNSVLYCSGIIPRVVQRPTIITSSRPRLFS